MKTSSIIRIILFFFLVLAINSLQAQDSTKTENKPSPKVHGQHFIDRDGDGYNDNAPDHDGDGIPNGLDPDWQKLRAEKTKKKKHRFVDLDGDGINDNLEEMKQYESGKKQMIQNQNQNKNQKQGSSMETQSTKSQNKTKKKRSGHN